MKQKNALGCLLAFWLAMVLALILFASLYYAAIVYVAVHFIRKFW
jgi:hypothetical protein